jgi:hypothetical protein
MTPIAVVTGSPDRVGAVAEELTAVGFQAIRVDDLSTLDAVCAQLGPESVAAYVQLPVQIAAKGSTAVARIREFLSQGLLFRYAAVDQVLPTLQADACVALVSGNLPADLTAPDDQRGRLALMRVLAHGVLADTAGRGVRTLVIDHQRSAKEIAAAVVEQPQNLMTMIAEVVAGHPDMSYDDWRFELLRVASAEI